MIAYYNEIEKYPVRWLKNLVRDGHIAPGVVDGRSILDVDPEDIGRGQAHFFAGIGIWSCALRMAGVPDDFQVWTGSCPCQPFSIAGSGKGTDDDRHLWPVWREIIRAKMPTMLFGEQVASPSGRRWLATVQADLEAMGYRFAAADLCAAGVGAPHIRQRLFFGAVRVADGDDAGQPTDQRRQRPPEARNDTRRICATGRLGDADKTGLERHRAGEAEEGRAKTARHNRATDLSNPWGDADYALCTDGKARPLEPGLVPLVNGYPGRVDEIKACGNAIVPQVAAAFVMAFLDSI